MKKEERKALLDATEYLYSDAMEALDKGLLTSRPVDDAAIIAYGITRDELAPFMGEEYLDTHWSDILDMVLDNRKKSAHMA